MIFRANGSGSAGTQPYLGIAWRAHRDDESTAPQLRPKRCGIGSSCHPPPKQIIERQLPPAASWCDLRGGMPDHNGAYHRFSASIGQPRSTFTLKDEGLVQASSRRRWWSDNKVGSARQQNGLHYTKLASAAKSVCSRKLCEN